MILSEELEKTLYRAYEQAKRRKHEFITPEHILLELLDDTSASEALLDCGLDLETLRTSIAERGTSGRAQAPRAGLGFSRAETRFSTGALALPVGSAWGWVWARFVRAAAGASWRLDLLAGS